MSDLRGQLLFTIERSVGIDWDQGFHTFINTPRSMTGVEAMLNDFLLIGLGYGTPYLDLGINNQMALVFDPIADLAWYIMRRLKRYQGLEQQECLNDQLERIIEQLQ